MSKEEAFRGYIKKVFWQLAFLFSMFVFTAGILVFYMYNPNYFIPKTEMLVAKPVELDEDRIENGIHVSTGLVDADGLMLVVRNCTNCHSAKLVTQNRMSTERWNATIAWMQETQNLWDLGKNQEIIVNYLVTNYPPVSKGRRMVLKNIDWYTLED